MSSPRSPLPRRLAGPLRGRVPRPARGTSADRRATDSTSSRGAIDARLHPQVRRSRAAPRAVRRARGRPARRPPPRVRGAGRRGVLGRGLGDHGDGPLVYDGYGSYRDGRAAVPFLLLSVALLVAGLVGHMIRLPPSRPIARIGAVIAMGFSLLWSVGAVERRPRRHRGRRPRDIRARRVPGRGPLQDGGDRGHRRLRGGRWVRDRGNGRHQRCHGIRDGAYGAVPVFLVAALSAAPIWLGIGGSLVAGTEPARLRPA